MIIILDSNEYIISLNKKTQLPDKIFLNNQIYINEIIVKEILRNIKESLKSQFYKLLFKDSITLYNEKLPINLFEKNKN